MNRPIELALIVAGIDEEYQNSIIEGIASCAKEKNVNISCFAAFGGVISNSKYDLGEYNIYKLVNYDKLDGVILLTNTISDPVEKENIIKRVKASKLPTVVLDDANYPEMHNIKIDNSTAMKAIVHHVIEKHGAKKVNYVSGPLANPEAEDRYNAFITVMAEHRLPVDIRRVYFGEFRSVDGKRAVESFMKQVLIDGYFHADPHAGNIMILKDNIVCYLDLGSVGILDDDFRNDLCELLMLLADKDVNGLINQFMYMGIINYNMDTTNLKRDLREMFFRYFEGKSSKLNEILDKLLDLMQDYGVILPNEFVSMSRGISMIESDASSLDSNMDIMAIIEPIVKEVMEEKSNIKDSIMNKKGSIIYYKNMLKTLPSLLTNIVHKINNGDMKLKFEIDRLDRLVSKFSLVVIIAALLMSSSIVMTINRGPMLFDMPLIAVLGYIVTFILGMISVINYLYGR